MTLNGRRPRPVLEARAIVRRLRPAARHPRRRPRGRPGEVVALLGANGAGKTTTLLTLAASCRRSRARSLIDGVVDKAPLHKRARNGLTFVTEEKSVFMGLSTRDNLRVAGVDVDEALDAVPRAGAASARTRRPALGRRAADAHAGAGAGPQAPRAAGRRAVDGPRRRWSSSACSRPYARPPTSRAPPCCSSSSTSARRSRTPTGPT